MVVRQDRMRTLVAMVVVCATVGAVAVAVSVPDAVADPAAGPVRGRLGGAAAVRTPDERAALRVAARWYAAVRRGDARAVAALTAPSVAFTFDTGGRELAEDVRRPRGRAAMMRAVARWREALAEFPPSPPWSSQATSDDWREVGFRTRDESFGELTVRVAHGRVVAVGGFWSWGGI